LKINRSRSMSKFKEFRYIAHGSSWASFAFGWQTREIRDAEHHQPEFLRIEVTKCPTYQTRKSC
jgi:hypothetical protein